MLVLDRAPEPPGALVLTPLGRHAGKDADAEDAAGAIVELDGDLERLAGMSLAFLEQPGIQGQTGELRQRSALPPRHACFLRERDALADELERARLSSPSSRAIAPSVPVVCARPHRSPAAPVDRVARLDQLTRTFEVASNTSR